MSYSLTHLRCAKVIQRFYKTYIKAERDPANYLPLDPISRDSIPKERQLKLFITANGKIRCIQYFDIYNLDTWFTTREEPLNPLTNLDFTQRQLIDIRNCYNRVGLSIPHILQQNYVVVAQAAEAAEAVAAANVNVQVEEEYLVEICANPMAIDEVRDILYGNMENIHNDTFSINKLRNIDSPLISTATALMNAVLHDNILAVQELLYFNPAIDISDTVYNYKAIDLAIISEGEHSIDILKHLLFHGARLDIPTKNGHSYELTNDIYKLELIYNFL
jgi:hypothetical protein